MTRAEGPSLLASRAPNARTPEEVAPCGDRWVWCRSCGLTVRARCRRNGCEWCGPINARQTARAIALAAPERSYLLTLAGDDFQVIRAKVNRWRYRVRKAVVPAVWADCWHVEPNPSGDGEHHVHGLAHGAFVKVETFRAAAVREGFGSWVGLKAVRSQSGAAFYGVKLAALAASAYSLKGVGSDLETFLTANGGRMVHASRSFWREPGGGLLPGVRVARSIAQWRLRSEDSCPTTGESHDWDGEGFDRRPKGLGWGGPSVYRPVES